MVHQVFGTIGLHLVEVLDLVGGEPVVNGWVQYRVGSNLSQRLGPFQPTSEISWLALVVLRTAGVWT